MDIVSLKSEDFSIESAPKQFKEQETKIDGIFTDYYSDDVIREEQDGLSAELYALKYSENLLRREMEYIDLVLSPLSTKDVDEFREPFSLLWTDNRNRTNRQAKPSTPKAKPQEYFCDDENDVGVEISTGTVPRHLYDPYPLQFSGREGISSPLLSVGTEETEESDAESTIFIQKQASRFPCGGTSRFGCQQPARLAKTPLLGSICNPVVCNNRPSTKDRIASFERPIVLNMAKRIPKSPSTPLYTNSTLQNSNSSDASDCASSIISGRCRTSTEFFQRSRLRQTKSLLLEEGDGIAGCAVSRDTVSFEDEVRSRNPVSVDNTQSPPNEGTPAAIVLNTSGLTPGSIGTEGNPGMQAPIEIIDLTGNYDPIEPIDLTNETRKANPEPINPIPSQETEECSTSPSVMSFETVYCALLESTESLSELDPESDMIHVLSRLFVRSKLGLVVDSHRVERIARQVAVVLEESLGHALPVQEALSRLSLQITATSLQDKDPSFQVVAETHKPNFGGVSRKETVSTSRINRKQWCEELDDCSIQACFKESFSMMLSTIEETLCLQPSSK